MFVPVVEMSVLSAFGECVAWLSLCTCYNSQLVQRTGHKDGEPLLREGRWNAIGRAVIIVIAITTIGCATNSTVIALAIDCCKGPNSSERCFLRQFLHYAQTSNIYAYISQLPSMQSGRHVTRSRTNQETQNNAICSKDG